MYINTFDLVVKEDKQAEFEEIIINDLGMDAKTHELFEFVHQDIRGTLMGELLGKNYFGGQYIWSSNLRFHLYNQEAGDEKLKITNKEIWEKLLPVVEMMELTITDKDKIHEWKIEDGSFTETEITPEIIYYGGFPLRKMTAENRGIEFIYIPDGSLCRKIPDSIRKKIHRPNATGLYAKIGTKFYHTNYIKGIISCAEELQKGLPSCQ